MKKNVLNKKNGMSVQSIIIGSVISGVIARRGLAMLWSSVDRAKLVVEKSTTKELKNGMSNLGYVLTDNVDTANLKSFYQQLPNNLNYGIFSVKGTNSSNRNYNTIRGSYVGFADYNNERQVNHLKFVVRELNKFYDNRDAQSRNFDYLGNFMFNDTCTDYSNCWYSFKNYKIEQSGIMSPRGTIINTKDSNNKNVLQLMLENENGNYDNGGWKVSYQKLN